MHIVFGLGNPGKDYEKTRHNVGFMSLDVLAKRYNATFSKGKGKYLQTKLFLPPQNTSLILIKPLTYMNLSGHAVREVVDYFKIDSYYRTLVVYDDFNLPFGTLRLKPNGSAGGQNGLKSIINMLNTNEIPRLRIGIGNQNFSSGENTKNFVLDTFKKSEKESLETILEWSADTIESFVLNTIDETMNKYNRNYL